MSPPRLEGDFLNPVQLAFAERGYHIQSRVLHMPDRLGWFSQSPPRLQVYEAGRFAWTALTLVSFASGVIVLIIMRAVDRDPIQDILWYTKMWMTLLVIFILIARPRVEPDHDWDAEDTERRRTAEGRQEARTERAAGGWILKTCPLRLDDDEVSRLQRVNCV
ncbi:hypothetical protein VTK56DRAFT_5964 [Thermocarpiscus australiensis]